MDAARSNVSIVTVPCDSLPTLDARLVGLAEEVESVDFFANLLSGGKLQREADERLRKKRDAK